MGRLSEEVKAGWVSDSLVVSGDSPPCPIGSSPDPPQLLIDYGFGIYSDGSRVRFSRAFSRVPIVIVSAYKRKGPLLLR